MTAEKSEGAYEPDAEASAEGTVDNCKEFIADAESLKGRFSNLSIGGGYEKLLSEIRDNPDDPTAKEAAQKLEEITADYLAICLRKEDLNMRLGRVGKNMKDLHGRMKRVFEITGTLSQHEAQLEELKREYNEYWTAQGDESPDTLIS
jgi:hypothetical protein